jgi:hypothetical protein
MPLVIPSVLSVVATTINLPQLYPVCQPPSAFPERSGRPISGNDLLIPAHAVTLGHTLVTDNDREFARIDDLPHENWLRPT